MTDQNELSPEPMLPVMTEAKGQKPQKTSKYGIFSFIFGIIAIFTFGFTSPLGFVFAIISIVEIRMNKHLIKGRFYVISGTIINTIMMAVLIFMIIFEVSALNVRKTHACSTNLRRLGVAMMMYADDNNDRFPPSNRWIDSISRYAGPDPAFFLCPSERGNRFRSSYGMNDDLGGVRQDELNDRSRTALLFDAIPGDCLHGGQELVPSPERHILYLKEDGVDIYDMEKNGNKGKRYLKVNNFCFADGHVKPVTIDEVPSLIWKPLKH